jgi:hypothetical protein
MIDVMDSTHWNLVPIGVFSIAKSTGRIDQSFFLLAGAAFFVDFSDGSAAF